VRRAGIAAYADEGHVKEVRALYRRKRETLLPALDAAGLRLAAATRPSSAGSPSAAGPRTRRAGCSSAACWSRRLALRPGRRGPRPAAARPEPGRLRAGGGDPARGRWSGGM